LDTPSSPSIHGQDGRTVSSTIGDDKENDSHTVTITASTSTTTTTTTTSFTSGSKEEEEEEEERPSKMCRREEGQRSYVDGAGIAMTSSPELQSIGHTSSTTTITTADGESLPATVITTEVSTSNPITTTPALSTPPPPPLLLLLPTTGQQEPQEEGGKVVGPPPLPLPPQQEGGGEEKDDDEMRRRRRWRNEMISEGTPSYNGVFYPPTTINQSLVTQLRDHFNDLKITYLTFQGLSRGMRKGGNNAVFPEMWRPFDSSKTWPMCIFYRNPDLPQEVYLACRSGLNNTYGDATSPRMEDPVWNELMRQGLVEPVVGYVEKYREQLNLHDKVR